MKNAKPLSLLFFSLLLLLIAAFILLFTWGYFKFYYSIQDTNSKTQLTAVNPTAINNVYRDSLQKVYTTAINNISTGLDTTLQNVENPAAFYSLKKEITEILKTHPLLADLEIASKKITELQNKLAELYTKNINSEYENNRLNGKLSQLSNEMKGMEQNIKTNSTENKNGLKSTDGVPAFTVSQLYVYAVNDVGQETLQAEETEKLSGSFTVKNNLSAAGSIDIMVVVQQPDGHVLQNSTWEAGTFETHEGRKVYSSKLHFEYATGDAKHLLFSLPSEKFLKGEYIIQVYYNGTLIGKTLKTLS